MQRSCDTRTLLLSYRQPEPPIQTSRNPSVYHYTVSRTIELSLQSSFQSSVTVLFAIGLGVIFSLMRSLPHTLSCTPKQLDSRSTPAKQADGHYGPITLYG